MEKRVTYTRRTFAPGPAIAFRVLILSLLALALMALVLSSSVRAEDRALPIKVLDSLGRELIITNIPQRIVSTVPSNTEILYDLNLRDRVVAVTEHCGLTCDVEGKETVGGWAEADVEKIRSLRPDLVLAFGGLQVPFIDRLDRLGVPVFSFCPKTVSETLHLLKVVGRVTGTQERAGELVQQATRKLDALKLRLKDIPQGERVRCLRLISPRERIVAGRYSFQHDIMVQAGGEDIMAGFLRDYGSVDFHSIHSMAPQVIVLNGDDEKRVRGEFLKMEGWKDLPAAKDGRLIVMPCRMICHPGFRIAEVVETLARGFYPERFR